MQGLADESRNSWKEFHKTMYDFFPRLLEHHDGGYPVEYEDLKIVTQFYPLPFKY